MAFYYNEIHYNLDEKLKAHNVAFEDREIIKKYIAHKYNTDNITPASERRITGFLMVFWRYIDKPLSELTIDDVLEGVSSLKKGKTCPNEIMQKAHVEPKPLAKNTIAQAVITFKGFLKWASKKGYSKITLNDIEEYLNAPKGKDLTEIISPEDILTESEIIALAQNARTERDRALIMVTYETGARIGEIQRSVWKDAVFEDIEGVPTFKFYIGDSKKTQRRYARLTLSAPNLIALKNVMKPGESDYIFSKKNHPLGYSTINKIFKTMAKSADINKPVNPHALRHARATNMLKSGYSESIVKKQLWNNQNSNMLKTYVALGSDDIDRETLKIAGIKEIRAIAQEKKPENIPCPNCHTINNSSYDHCYKCGHVLSEKAIAAKKSDEEEAANTYQAVQQKKLEEMEARMRQMEELLKQFDNKKGKGSI
jgi:site-specific recombinase XerD